LPGGQSYIELAQQNTNLRCTITVAASPTNYCSVPFDAVNHHYWRMSEAGGAVSWQTSPDGTAWTTLATQASPFPLDDVSIVLGAGAVGANASPGTATFDSYDMPP